MTGRLPTYALIIAEVVDYERGDVQIRYVTPDGKDATVWMDTSNVAPLRAEEAESIATQWNIALPG